MRKIAILGFGTVGSGVYEVLKAAEDITIQYIVDLREFPGHPLADRVTTCFDKVLADAEVEVVVETMGGVKIAYDYTKRALLAGKSVVTSNKAVVDACGEELEAIAREKGVSYLYEASVGGGIPIIRPLRDCFAADRILKISGILNGTTNYILTRMEEAGCTMEEALAEAQALGYAEQDPTADIEGHDAARKICILAGLAFGRYIPYTEVRCLTGIRDVTAEDIKLAAIQGYAIRLLGTVERVCLDGKEHLRLAVAPYLVSLDSLLHAVKGAFNAISVTGESVGEVLFYGQGAGSMPTASAVACDVREALSRKPIPSLRTPLEDGYVLPDCATHRTVTLSNGKTYFAL
ncbi:MAG: homoserine dehydrogenase [Oscillospiraceae bacterium]|nr:homoserine dehydrogenase [Oscillospiraceae bacterium]